MISADCFVRVHRARGARAAVWSNKSRVADAVCEPKAAAWAFAVVCLRQEKGVMVKTVCVIVFLGKVSRERMGE